MVPRLIIIRRYLIKGTRLVLSRASVESSETGSTGTLPECLGLSSSGFFTQKYSHPLKLKGNKAIFGFRF